MGLKNITTTIFSGTVVSTPGVDLRNGSFASVFAPTVTSGDLLLRGAVDASSAFFRVKTSSGDVALAMGPGSDCCVIPEHVVRAIPVLALESGVAQAADRVFTIAVRF